MLTRNRLSSHTHSEIEQDAVISVGKDYQARLPHMEKLPTNKYYSKKRKYEVVFWNNSFINLSEERLKEFIQSAKVNYNYTEEMVLGLINWERGNLDAVEKDFLTFVPKQDSWSTEEKIKLFVALDSYNKNFNSIKTLFPHKSSGQLVAAYYLFKKNSRFLNELNSIGSAVGTSIFSKVKKYDSILPKHYLAKFGNIVRALPQSRSGINFPGGNSGPSTSWSDHPISDSLCSYVQQIQQHQNLHCSSRILDHEHNILENIGRSNRKPKKVHKCIYDHKKWLKHFYQAYDHETILQQLQLTQEERESNILTIDRNIINTNTIINSLESNVLNKSKDLLDSLRKWKSKIPIYNSKWTEKDIQLLQLAINQCGGDIKVITSVLGCKTINMVKNFVSLYSQRLHIDESILKELLSSSCK